MAYSPVDRRQLMLARCDLGGQGLEYGPLCRPIVDRSRCSVRYVDYTDRETLMQRYANNKAFDPREIVSVDVVTELMLHRLEFVV